VLGHAVNGAIALEARNEALGTTILVSREVLERLPAELAALAEPRGEHRVRVAELAIFSLRDRSS
jgi:hypothetical protein